MSSLFCPKCNEFLDNKPNCSSCGYTSLNPSNLDQTYRKAHESYSSSFDHFKYYIDNSGYYTYVLFDGDELLKKKIESNLTSNKYLTLLSGKSFRPASNNKQYDWYIRVADMHGNLKPSLQELSKSFEHIFEDCKAENRFITEKECELSFQRAKLRRELEDHKKTIKKQHKTIVNLERQIGLVRSENERLSNYILDHEKIEKKNKRKIATNNVQILKKDLNQLDRQNRKYKSDIGYLKKELEEANKLHEKEVQDCLNEINRYSEDNEKLNQKIYSLNYQLCSRQEPQKTNELVKIHKPQTNFENTLKLLLPNIDFQQDALENIYIAAEEKISRAVLQSLKHLNDRNMPSGSKKLSGLNGVYERYVPNVNDPRAEWRLYWKNGDKADLVKVLFKPKKEQKKNIKFMKMSW